MSNAAASQNTSLAMTDAKLYVTVVTLSTQDNTKLWHKLRPDFKRIINWNKYQSNVTTKVPS